MAIVRRILIAYSKYITRFVDVIEYETWGNARDGFEVNNAFTVEKDVALIFYLGKDGRPVETDRAINARFKWRDVKWGEGEWDYSLYGSLSSNGKPVLELRRSSDAKTSCKCAFTALLQDGTAIIYASDREASVRRFFRKVHATNPLIEEGVLLDNKGNRLYDSNINKAMERAASNLNGHIFREGELGGDLSRHGWVRESGYVPQGVYVYPRTNKNKLVSLRQEQPTKGE